MSGQGTAPQWDVFISHASEDDALATRLCEDLATHHISVWVDHRDLRRKGLLLDALQTAIEQCRHVVLVWSQHSAVKRYVSAEWNFAWNRERSIVPCRTDSTQLPLGLAGYLYCDFRSSFEDGAGQLRDALRDVASPSAPAPASPGPPAPPPLVAKHAYDEIYAGQSAVLDALGQGDVARSTQLQRALDPVVTAAEQQFPHDPVILALAGYHLKNAYQIRHWTEIQSRETPSDPLLGESEQRFWEVLKYRPNDAGALNGLGSILWLRGDLDAAEFYMTRSIERARQEGYSYPYAEEDLRNLRAERSARARR